MLIVSYKFFRKNLKKKQSVKKRANQINAFHGPQGESTLWTSRDQMMICFDSRVFLPSNCYCLMKGQVFIGFWGVFKSLECICVFEIVVQLQLPTVSASSCHFLDYSSAVKLLLVYGPCDSQRLQQLYPQFKLILDFPLE